MYTESCKYVRKKMISKSQEDSCGMIAVSLADTSVPGRPDIPDRLLEWALKITCQLTPRGPSQEGRLSHSAHGIPSSQALCPTCAGSATCLESTAQFLV